MSMVIHSKNRRFSLRKYKIGVVSVLLGTILLLPVQQVSADEQVAGEVVIVQEANTSETISEGVLAEPASHFVTESLVVEQELTVPILEENLTVSQPSEVAFEATLAPASSVVLEQEEISSQAVEFEPVVEEGSEAPSHLVDESVFDTEIQEKAVFETRTVAETIMTRSAAPTVIGDDYPWKNAARPYKEIDPWRLYKRECTSFVAYRLSSVNQFELPPAYGDAGQWGYRAQREGYRVDLTPARGAVVWYAPGAMGAYGHVAWVANVYGDKIEIEDYNSDNRGRYSTRLIDRTSVSGYIHFKDLTASSGTVSQPVSYPSTAELPESGTYTFTQKSGVKSQPKLSAPNLDYYEIGEIVNYDRKLEADGYQWISYINYRGSRSYVAIKQLATMTPVAQPTPVQNLPQKGSYTFTKRTSIQSEPILSSPEITFYQAGERVNYDRVITSDGHQWISYISYSGVRRYARIT